MNSKSLLRHVKRLEKVFAVGEADGWIEVLMWSASEAGVFGHVRMRIFKSGRQTEWKACTEEEELLLMRKHYEEGNRRLYGRGDTVPFSVFLENHCYLGPPEFADRRREIIERLRSEENATRG